MKDEIPKLHYYQLLNDAPKANSVTNATCRIVLRDTEQWEESMYELRTLEIFNLLPSLIQRVSLPW